jgi:hypothetical protein
MQKKTNNNKKFNNKKIAQNNFVYTSSYWANKTNEINCVEVADKNSASPLSASRWEKNKRRNNKQHIKNKKKHITIYIKKYKYQDKHGFGFEPTDVYAKTNASHTASK